MMCDKCGTSENLRYYGRDGFTYICGACPPPSDYVPPRLSGKALAWLSGHLFSEPSGGHPLILAASTDPAQYSVPEFRSGADLSDTEQRLMVETFLCYRPGEYGFQYGEIYAD